MRQFPAFVEWGGGRIAAVVTAPDGDPGGIVISLAGTGRHNLIGSTMCAKLSQRLAVEGLASVRLDYAGVGDSPGLVPLWTLTDVGAATRQARAVLREAMDALGVERFVAVGTCYGTRVALSLVPDASCAGAICLAPPVLDYGGLAHLSRQRGGRSILSFIRSNAALSRLARPLRGTLQPRRPAGAVVGAFEHLDRAPIAFLYGTPSFDDHYSRRAREVLDATLAALPSAKSDRFDLQILPWGPLSTFDILPPAEQDAVLDVIVPLACRHFSAAEPAPRTASVTSGTR